MRKLVKLLTLSPRRWVRLATAYRLLAKAHMSTRRTSDTTRLPVETDGGTSASPPLTIHQWEEIAEAVWSIEVAHRHPFKWARCLQVSLALVWWLESKGIETRLKIGVRKDGAELKAHAWVEYGGRVLNDRQRTPLVFVPLAPASESIGGRMEGLE